MKRYMSAALPFLKAGIRAQGGIHGPKTDWIHCQDCRNGEYHTGSRATFCDPVRPQPAASQTGKCLGHQAVLPQKARPYANGCRKGLSKIWPADAHWKKGSLQHHQRPCSRQLRPSFLYLFSGARPWYVCCHIPCLPPSVSRHHRGASRNARP